MDTNITITDITHNGRIYALSDIHGDLYSFIISLRDCAKVIKKDINLTIVDKDIENNLIKDISNDDESYDESFGYEWCGNNSYVVICGDMIDPNRLNSCKRDDGHICGDYPQIEIKLLRFINNMNKKAMESGGRIIKLLGNHELMNIIGNVNLDYIYNSHLVTENYYRGCKREDIFNVGQIGFTLLFQDGCYILIKINNTIFVHGQLPNNKNIFEIDSTNIFMNNKENHLIEKLEEWKSELKEYNDNTSLLWNREWGDPNLIYARHDSKIQEKYCTESIQNDLSKFMGTPNIDKLRVVLGHCPQNSSSYHNYINTTMTHKIVQDYSSKTYSSKTIHTDKIDMKNQDTIFGITMQCPKVLVNGYTDFYVYHIDVGSSRGFDHDKYYKEISTSESEPISIENKYLFSKTPQILSIEQFNDNDFITIIKSKMKNTRIHLPRPNYENLIKNMTSLKLDSGNYDIKYKKYKNKYLKLKKLYFIK